MVEQKLTQRANLLHLLFGRKPVERPRLLDEKTGKPRNEKDADWPPEAADRKVLVEYYKNLGRGPM